MSNPDFIDPPDWPDPEAVAGEVWCREQQQQADAAFIRARVRETVQQIQLEPSYRVRWLWWLAQGGDAA